MSRHSIAITKLYVQFGLYNCKEMLMEEETSNNQTKQGFLELMKAVLF